MYKDDNQLNNVLDNHSYIIESLTFPEECDNLAYYSADKFHNLKYLDLSKTKVSVIPQKYAYYQTNLQTLLLPETLILIDDYAFANCIGLTSITIPNNVTNIGMYAFCGCLSLTSITIPEGIETLYGTFTDSGLVNITLKGHVPPKLSSGPPTFNSCPLQNIYVPAEALEIYKKAPFWSNYADLIQPIPES